MNQVCPECKHMKFKLTQLITHYEELLLAKDHEIVCSYSIVRQLQQQVLKVKEKHQKESSKWKDNAQMYRRTVSEQDQAIEYLKERENKLVNQIKKIQNQIFLLSSDENSDREEVDKEQRIVNVKKTEMQKGKWEQSFLKSIRKKKGGNDGVKLKVAEDNLNVSDIKYRMAMLKAVEIKTFQSAQNP